MYSIDWHHCRYFKLRSQHYLDLRFCQITYCQKTYCPIAVCQITFCQKAVCQKTFCLLTDTPKIVSKINPIGNFLLRTKKRLSLAIHEMVNFSSYIFMTKFGLYIFYSTEIFKVFNFASSAQKCMCKL